MFCLILDVNETIYMRNFQYNHLPLSIILTLSDAAAADGFLKKIVTKEEIAQNEQFLLLPQCFQLLVIGYPFNYRDFLMF